jgi:hypothetical protein
MNFLTIKIIKIMQNKNISKHGAVKIFNLLEKKYHKTTIERMNNWLEANAHRFTNKNEKYNLKVGDIITFKNGYDIPMSTKIIAFNAETGNPYLYWDCYWVDLDLEKRLLKAKDKIEITDKIIKLNEKANAISSMQNEIIEHIEKLNKEKSFVFGYRTSCGSTDRTMKVFRIWLQTLKEFEKQGVFLRSENLTVGNSYATLKGGFWNEVRYFF